MKGLVNKLWYDLYHIYLYHEIPINSNWYLILATQETEIRRIMVRSQLRANSSWRLISKKTLHQKKKKKGGGAGGGAGGVAQGVGPEFKTPVLPKTASQIEQQVYMKPFMYI
jgi:hypothetical protein